MDCALYDSFYDLVGDECNMSLVCENASMSVKANKCDDMSFESMGVVDKLLRKMLRSFKRI